MRWRGDRLIGVVQPAPEAAVPSRPPGKDFPLRRVGCAGRISSFTESEDGRVVITLAGDRALRARGRCRRATSRSASAAVDFAPYAKDFVGGHGEDDVDRPRLIATLRSYLIANNLHADWDRINSASNERLVNALSILSPYGPEEKQAPARGARLAGARRGAGRARRDGACGARRRLRDIAAMTAKETHR